MAKTNFDDIDLKTPLGSSNIAAGAVTSSQLASQSVTAAKLNGNLKTGYVHLPLTAFRAVATNAIPAKGATPPGGLLASDTTPILERANGATDKALRIRWAANDVTEITQSFPYPPDLDDTQPLTVDLLLAKDTNTDVAAVVGVGYFEGVGDANAGGNTAALAAAALALKTVAIAAGDVGAYPAMASVSVIPGAHANDAVLLYGAYVTYTRKS